MLAFCCSPPLNTSNCKGVHEPTLTTSHEVSSSPCFTAGILSHQESDLSKDRQWQSQERQPACLRFVALPTGYLPGEQRHLPAAGNSPQRFPPLPFPTACSFSSPSPSFNRVLSLSFGSPFMWAASSGWVHVLAPCETVSHILLSEARLEIFSPPHDCCRAFCGTPHWEMPRCEQANSQTAVKSRTPLPILAVSHCICLSSLDVKWLTNMSDRTLWLPEMRWWHPAPPSEIPSRQTMVPLTSSATQELPHWPSVISNLSFPLKHLPLLSIGNDSGNTGPVGITCMYTPRRRLSCPVTPHPEASHAGCTSQNRVATYFQKLASTQWTRNRVRLLAAGRHAQLGLFTCCYKTRGCN